jgi:hypothetical protein
MTSRMWICLLSLWISGLGFAGGGSSQAPLRLRMVIAAGVVCRTQPSQSAEKVYAYKLGDLAGVSKETQQDGAYWYFDQWRISGQSPACWIYGPLTTEFVESDPELALLAVIDHVLLRPAEARFEDYVAVENLLAEPRFSSVVKTSGLLQFRKLDILNQAVSREDARGRTLDRDPLRKAWVLSHGDLVYYFDPDDQWHVRPAAYWSLYEKYQQAPWAEELAATAAQLFIPGDECYANCLLDKIDKTFLQYWTRYPKGSAIGPALTKASALAKSAADLACLSKETDYSVPRSLLAKIRISLQEVAAPEKRQLLRYLDHIERKCYPNQR